MGGSKIHAHMAQLFVVIHSIIPLGFILAFPEGKHFLIQLPHLIFQRPGRPLFSLVLSMPHNIDPTLQVMHLPS